MGKEVMNDGSMAQRWTTPDGGKADPHGGCYGKSEVFESLGGGQRVCWGVLPVREGEGDPGQRGSWQGGPLSSSPPPVPGSAVQTAPPAP